MAKRGYILILALAVCGVAMARAISIVHSRADRIHEHGRASGSKDFGSKMRQIAGANPASVKPWALDEVAFRNAHGNRSWIIGRSDKPAMSDSEAIESAHADATRALYPVIRSRVQAWPGDRRWLEWRIDSQVSAGRLDADTNIERFDRPYGSVYAASVLLDASADRLDPLAREMQLGLMARHRQAGIHLAIAGGLLTLTWLGYALLNSITRGYVTARLRWIAAGITVGVLLLA